MYELVILATRKNIPILEMSLPYIRKNIDVGKINVIANKRDFEFLNQLNVNLVDEGSIFPGLDFENVSILIEKRCGERKRAGWYLQQFIKMSWCYRTKEPYYVVFDADTIPLQHIDYIDETGKYLLTLKKEYHKPYFDTLLTLFDGAIQRWGEGSFIAENMIFDSNVMKELIISIEANKSIPGIYFYEKIINSIDVSCILKSGFSEFETYGNYVYKKYNDKVTLRKLKTNRESMQIIGSKPSREQLEWASREYQLISIEASDYPHTLLTRLTDIAVFRKIFKMSTVVSLRTKIRSKYRKLIGKEDYVFD